MFFMYLSFSVGTHLNIGDERNLIFSSIFIPSFFFSLRKIINSYNGHLINMSVKNVLVCNTIMACHLSTEVLVKHI